MQFHRGPDDKGIFFDSHNNFCLGMTRLSIVDLDHGNQPFFSEDRNFCIVFNGEIINARELRTELENKKVKFLSNNSDTELLLKMLIYQGKESIKKLNGMFAFCFYDLKKKEIFIARDRFGIKPLYFFFEKNYFGFASELKTALSLYNKKLDIDHESVSDYLSLMYIPSPKTIFKQISKLSAGEKLIFNFQNNFLKKEKWFEPSFKPDDSLNFNNASEQLKKLCDKAVVDWTTSDVPIANSLSGGIDSSIISSVLGENNYKIKNFSLGFKDQEDKDYDEVRYAKLVSGKWSQEHSILRVSQDFFLDNLDKIVENIHQPYGGGLPSWMIYKNISKDYKVAFAGIGSDEFFGNYAKWSKLDSSFFNINFKSFKNSFFNERYYASEEEKKNILNFSSNDFISTAEKFYKIFIENEGSIKDKSAILDIKTQLPDEFLDICDKFSMAHSLEVRPPFLDNNLTNFLFTIPSHIRVGNKKNLKKLLKSSYKNLLPSELLSIKKKGFILPIENWLKKQLNPLLSFYLSKKKINEHGLFKDNIYDKIVEPFLNRSFIISKFDSFHRKQTLIWGILFFQLWYEKIIQKKSITL
jgi:asparagine synthase (glutamine-hydrolysing)